ncbi:MAG: hypothetical protein Q4E38_10040 [Eubacteriales bacterium]|nr:hypothetical protein [Eubacteriales bacterium]
MGRAPFDLTGRRFGRLTAVERLGKKGSNYVWRCRCDCGGEAEVTVSRLLNGNTVSCGCLKRENGRARARDISGQHFGKLTALHPLEERRAGSVLWLCSCECGREKAYSYNELVHIGVKSCGCAQHPEKQVPLHYVDGTCVEMISPRRRRCDNTSGHTGVIRIGNGWRAQISFKGKTYYLGLFEEYEDAVKVRERAEKEIFGSFLEWYEKNRKKEKEKDRRSPASQRAGTASLLYYKD